MAFASCRVCFWLYTISCGMVLVGVATFGVMSFYTVFAGIAQLALVPVLSAVAMGVDAVFAAVAGAMFGRMGPRVLFVLPVVCAAIPFCACAENIVPVIASVVLWGASLGIQESTMRAAVAGMVPANVRASAYGMFAVATGIGSLLGGTIAGFLYGIAPLTRAIFTVCVEAAALVCLARAIRRQKA